MTSIQLRCYPNLFIIGSMRAGSTTLHEILKQHPDIFMSSVKEPYFFSAQQLRDQLKRPNLNASEKSQYKEQLQITVRGGRYRTHEAYHSLFEGSQNFKYRGESSHYLYHRNAAYSIKEHSPEASIIVSIRNPVERIYSEYGLLRRWGKFNGTFEEFIFQNVEKRDIKRERLEKGYQGAQIDLWIRVFGQAKVHIVLFDQLKSDPEKCYNKIFRWLNLAPMEDFVLLQAQRSAIPRNQTIANLVQKGGGDWLNPIKKLFPKTLRTRVKDRMYRSRLFKKERMPDDVAEKLRDAYKDDILKLRKLTGYDLCDWLKKP